jgi:hypothetical protein
MKIWSRHATVESGSLPRPGYEIRDDAICRTQLSECCRRKFSRQKNILMVGAYYDL